MMINNLSDMTVKELRIVCKEKGIKNYYKMKKSDIVDAILSLEIINSNNEVTDLPADGKGGEDVNEQELKKEQYKVEMQEGAIVAIILPDGKAISVKVLENVKEKRKAKVQSKLGSKFTIGYDNILWVKTSERYPTPVFNLLRGKTTNETK